MNHESSTFQFRYTYLVIYCGDRDPTVRIKTGRCINKVQDQFNRKFKTKTKMRMKIKIKRLKLLKTMLYILY